MLTPANIYAIVLCGKYRNNCKEVYIMDAFERVKEIMAEQLDVDYDSISLDTSFINDLEADSLDIVELIMAIEEEFDIEIPDEDAEKISTVGEAVSYINDII